MGTVSGTRVAVVAHQKKSLGGGLDELRAGRRRGRRRLLWYEVPKSRKAPKQVRKALEEGADLLLVWGGDGMVQRCVDALAGSGVPVAIIPAGTANLLAAQPRHPPGPGRGGAHRLPRRHRALDLGKLNGEHFAVMAGVGFDADMIKDADRGLKDRLGRLAYVWTGLATSGRPPRLRSRWTATSGSTATRVACCSATSAGSPAASPPSTTPARTTAGWRSASRPRGRAAVGPHAGPDGGRPVGQVAVRADHPRPEGAVTLGVPRCTSWTAAPATRCAR